MSNAQKVSDLLPCPFCGGEGTYQTDTEEDTFSEEWIGCTDCGATAAIEVWKRRAAPAPDAHSELGVKAWAAPPMSGEDNAPFYGVELAVVPQVPTDEMLWAGYQVVSAGGSTARWPLRGMRETWDAMLAAAPAEPDALTAGVVKAEPVAVTDELKERVLLAIIEKMRGGQADVSDYDWHWIGWFCDDAKNGGTDTFNRCIDKGWLRSTHDSDTDSSVAYITPAGRAALASKPEGER